MIHEKPKALLVDDNWTCLSRNEILLKKSFTCETAMNGFEAFMKFCEAVENKAPYTLILLDIKMPDMNGLQVLEAIRKVESLMGLKAAEIAKIIMVTSSDESHDIFTSFRKGCESYLVKPFTEEQLLVEVEKLGLSEAISV